MQGNGADRQGPPRVAGTLREPPRNARNQSLFREVNERIGQFANRSANGACDSYICECGDPRCTEPMKLTRAEYEAVREHANHFAILPSHENPATETVVERHGRYCVVEAKQRRERGAPPSRTTA